MLTPSEIANKKFEKSAFGYKTEEVDTFLAEIAESYSEIFSEKEAIEEKLEVLAEKLEEYRANEDSLRSVLIGAQKLGDNIVRDSKAKAEIIISEAEGQVKQVFSDSESKIAKERENLAMVQKETADFKKRLLAMYKQHLELISLMPEPDEEKAVPNYGEPEEPEQVKNEIEETEESEKGDEKFFDEVSMAETKRIELDVQE